MKEAYGRFDFIQQILVEEDIPARHAPIEVGIDACAAVGEFSFRPLFWRVGGLVVEAVVDEVLEDHPGVGACDGLAAADDVVPLLIIGVDGEAVGELGARTGNDFDDACAGDGEFDGWALGVLDEDHFEAVDVEVVDLEVFAFEVGGAATEAGQQEEQKDG